MFGPFEIDLFASRLNNQIPKYISWKCDPDAWAVDAMLADWTSLDRMYAFSPFSLLPAVFQKMDREKVDILVVLPLWRTQSWWPHMLSGLVDMPVVLDHHKQILWHPQYLDVQHPLFPKNKIVGLSLYQATPQNQRRSEQWETVSFRNLYVKDWHKARQFLQRVCVKKLSLAGMVLRRDIEAKSWQRIQKIVPLVTTLTELHFGRVPANVIEGLMEKLPENVNISAEFIIDPNDAIGSKSKTTSKFSEKQVDNMTSALTSVGSGMSSADAARLHNVPESDLLHLQQDRMYVLTPEEESLVVLCCIRLAQMGFTISISSFLIKCQEMFSRRYSTAVPLPIFDGACRQIYLRNTPFFNNELNQSTAPKTVALDRHYARLSDLYGSISRPARITREQVYTFDIQSFRLLADSQTLPRRPNATVTMLWATDADNLNLKPAMLVTPKELSPDQRHEKIIYVTAKNGVATPTHIQQYFRHLIASATKFPCIVLCSTDASNFSESLVSMCLQHQVYIANIQSDIANLVFPPYHGGLLHMLKRQVPPMSMKLDEFVSHLKLFLQNHKLNIHMNTKLSFSVTGVFPVNRRAPTQFQYNDISQTGTASDSATEAAVSQEQPEKYQNKQPEKATSKQPEKATSKQHEKASNKLPEKATNKQPEKPPNKEVEQEDSSIEFNESIFSEDEENESVSSYSDIQYVKKPKESIRASCRPSTLFCCEKPTKELVQENIKEADPQASTGGRENSRSSGKDPLSKESKEEKLDKLKKPKFSSAFLTARAIVHKSKRGPIKQSNHKYRPLKPLRPAVPLKNVIKKTFDGNSVISTLPIHSSHFKIPTEQNHVNLTTGVQVCKSPIENEPKDSELPPLIIDTNHKEEKTGKQPAMTAGTKVKKISTLSPGKNKALVCKHMQEAIDAVVEESREYARQVERGESHGDEIMPKKWMQRQREKVAAEGQNEANLSSAIVKKVNGTSIVLKTSSLGAQLTQHDEEEESDLEEEEEEDDDEVEEEEDADEEEAASSNEDEVEGAVEWTVSSQPKHKGKKLKKKKHKKQKKKHKSQFDSDEETPLKDIESRKKRKKSKKAKKKKKHKRKKSKSDPEEMDTSQETPSEKHSLNDDGIDEGSGSVVVKDVPLVNGDSSGDTTIANRTVLEDGEKPKINCREKDIKMPIQLQPSYISDHDYFSKFVDEDSVDIEKIDETDKMEVTEETSQDMAVECVTANGEGSKHTSSEHDYSKSAEGQVEEAMDISDQHVEVDVAERGNSAAPHKVTSSDSSDSSSDKTDIDSDSSSRRKSSSDSSKNSKSSSSASKENTDSDSDGESEPNKSSVSREPSSSPKKKLIKESSSSEESSTSGSESSDTDSESEEDEKKKKSATSFSDDENDDDSDEEGEEDKCQICMRSTPPHSKDVLIDWVDCDKNCGRWFHVICIKNSKFRSKSKSKNMKHYICPSCR
ncbi:hypothetical protein ElyMa_003905300 [Elysia marginata]|uniref:PHD-type domain-containing protein n=1 Tax=Elysia marginata TaxID=1093978 RepID=A0AAV4FPL0_9GAST|nr:hypothetical protein ElyMa_003905300 [Elysia marginata]